MSKKIENMREMMEYNITYLMEEGFMDEDDTRLKNVILACADMDDNISIKNGILDLLNNLHEAIERYKENRNSETEEEVKLALNEFKNIANNPDAIKELGLNIVDDDVNFTDQPIFIEEEDDDDFKSLILTPENTPAKNKITKQFLPTNKEDMEAKSPFKRKRADFTTPQKLPIWGRQIDDNSNENVDTDSLFNEDLPEINQNHDDDKELIFKSRSSGVRDGKDMKTVNEALSNKKYVMNNKTTTTLSTYRNNLWDILINGNYRVKFSPKCSTRTGAKAYCNKKYDDSGYPMYRLLPPNGSKDPFGNDICDLNGDKVDDIVIVDKAGKPVIVNGYKLVKASPYKKIWKETVASGKTDAPFNIWLQTQFETTRDWNYSREQWETGKFDYDINRINNEQAKKAYKEYSELGLGKPKIRTNITARGLWSSIFSKIWKLALCDMFDEQKELAPLRVIFNYMKVCNAVFIKRYETQLMAKYDCTGKWMKWVNYKRNHSKAVNAELGFMVQEDYNTNKMREVIPLNADIKSNVNLQNYQEIVAIIDVIKEVIENGLNLTEENLPQFKALSKQIENGVLEKSKLKKYKDTFKDRVDRYICSIAGNGYDTYRKQVEANKTKNIDPSKGVIEYRDHDDDDSEEEEQ